MLRFPRHYEKVYLENVYAMHLRNIKPPWRLLERQYLYGWISEENKEKYSYSFEEYLKACVKRDYGTEDLSKIAQTVLENIKETVVPYKKEIYGDYPKILKDYVWKKFGIKL